MSARQLLSHYEINKHYLNQDLKNAIALIVDNISLLSDEQLKQLRVAMDDKIMERYRLNQTPGNGYQPIARADDPINPQPPKWR